MIANLPPGTRNVGLAMVEVVCRYYPKTDLNVNYYTCAEIKSKYEL